ncbi:hypothetical protein PUN28_009565 [Cardiocondyla obscurior]|uniref:Uncharacterized protein n=1 Tax=Cardiocondyla obscurior TaxID=286306 RepID=A0AAW2FSS3_9HYME
MTPTFRWVFLLALLLAVVGRAASVPRAIMVDACALLCNPGAETESERERDPVLFPRYPKVNCELQSQSDEHQAWVIASHCMKLCGDVLSVSSEVNCFALRSSIQSSLGCNCDTAAPSNPSTMRLHETWRLNFLVNEISKDILTTILSSPLDTFILCDIHKELFASDLDLTEGKLVEACKSVSENYSAPDPIKFELIQDEMKEEDKKQEEFEKQEEDKKQEENKKEEELKKENELKKEEDYKIEEEPKKEEEIENNDLKMYDEELPQLKESMTYSPEVIPEMIPEVISEVYQMAEEEIIKKRLDDNDAILQKEDEPKHEELSKTEDEEPTDKRTCTSDDKTLILNQEDDFKAIGKQAVNEAIDACKMLCKVKSNYNNICNCKQLPNIVVKIG